MKKIFRDSAIGLALVIVVFVLLSPGYFIATARYYFLSLRHKQNLETNFPSTTISKSGQGVQVDPNILFIPSLGIHAPVKYVSVESEAEFQKALLDGVVHYPGSGEPGQVGNDYIFGHSSDYIWSPGHYKSIFALLPKIKNGALIELSSADGILYNYKVFKQLVVASDDKSVLSQDTKKKMLTLQTSYPVGTALKRYVVLAELIEK